MCKILYIDDDLSHAQFFKEVCSKRKNVSCDIIEKIEDYKEIIDNNKYDIYITDFLLGGYNGYNIIKTYPDKGWFLITSLPEELIPDYVKTDERIAKILYKPISVAEILEVIDNYINSKQ